MQFQTWSDRLGLVDAKSSYHEDVTLTLKISFF